LAIITFDDRASDSRGYHKNINSLMEDIVGCVQFTSKIFA